MRWVKFYGVLGLAVLAVGTIGCDAVSRNEFNALQDRYNAMSQDNEALRANLLDAQGREATMASELTSERLRAANTSSGSDDLRNEVARLEAELARKPKTVTVPGPRTGTKITLASDVLFPSGKASLTTAGKSRVGQEAAKIRRGYSGAKILIYGHTDSDPIRRSQWKDNLALSSERAAAVTRELVARGFSAKNIETVGMGSAEPVTSNATAAGKAKNRRVVIKILQ